MNSGGSPKGPLSYLQGLIHMVEEIKLNGHRVRKLYHFEYDTQTEYQELNSYSNMILGRIPRSRMLTIRMDFLVGQYDGPDPGQMEMMQLEIGREKNYCANPLLFEVFNDSEITTLKLYYIDQIDVYRSLIFDNRDTKYMFYIQSSMFDIERNYDVDRIVNAQVEHLLKPLYE
jgi:hypothetical protein